jgi:hypothetical protein
MSDIPNRNSKTISFQMKRTELRAEVDLNKEDCIEVTPPLA